MQTTSGALQPYIHRRTDNMDIPDYYRSKTAASHLRPNPLHRRSIHNPHHMHNLHMYHKS